MRHPSSAQTLRARLGGRNIYLIGMMGCGKSRTGPPLAKELSYGFVDSDAVIEQLAGMSIEKIFAEEGERAFREVEEKVLNSIGQRHSLVVATGGGVVTRSENWGVLHQGIVVWLDPGRDRLLARLKSDEEQRPLLLSSDPVVAFDALMDERIPLYSEADLHLLVADESPELVASAILEGLIPLLRKTEDLGGPHTIGESCQD